MRSLRFKIIVFLLLAVFKTVPSKKNLNTLVIGFINKKRSAFDLPKLSDDGSLETEAEQYAKHLASLNIKDQVLHEDTKTDDDHSEIDHEKYPLGHSPGYLQIAHSDYPQSDNANKKYTEVIFEFKGIRFPFAIKYFSVLGYQLYVKSDKNTVQQSIVNSFTALFWKSSINAGVGIHPKNTSNPTGRKIMVIRLTPPGNQPGGYDENINNLYQFDLGDLLQIATESGVSDHKLNRMLALNVIISSVIPILVKDMF